MRRRPHLAAALVFAVLAMGFVGPGLLPGHTLSNSDSFWFKSPWAPDRPASVQRPANPEFDDAPAVLQPFVRYARRHLPDVPLWNPHIVTGRPFLADAQSAVLSPFTLPAYVLDFWTALGWIAALKLWTAAFGAYLLGRRLGMRFAGAMLTGAVYGFNLWLVTWLSYPHASVWALVPWLLVAADRAVRRPDARGAAPLALLVGLQFLCGHPESSFHALLATAAFAVARVLCGRRAEGAAPLRPLLAVGAATAVGAALAAIVLLPFVELLLRSADLQQRAGSAKDSYAPHRYALMALLPDYWGRPTQTPLELFQLARAFYGSALALMLAGAALLLAPSRGRLLVAATGALLMLVVLGIPPVFDVVVALPVFSSGHNTRLAILALLCLAVLAGWGLDDLLARRGGAGRRRALLAGAAALFVLPVAFVVLGSRSSWDAVGDALRVAWGFEHPPGPLDPRAPDVVRGSAVLIWTAVAGVAVALLAAAIRRGAGPVLAGLAVALVVLDLARAGMGYNPALERDEAIQPSTPALDLLRRQNPARFVAVGDIPQDAVPVNHGLYEARGYDLPVERRFDRLWRTRLSPEFPSQVGPYPQYIPLSLPRVDADRLRMLGVLGVTHVLQPPGDDVLRVPGLEVVYEGPDARVYRSGAAQPRAAVVGAQRVVGSGEAALDAVAAPGFELAREAVTEERLPGVPAGAPAAAGPARITTIEPDRLVVRADARRAGLLVVTDAWDPGWTAKVDGREVDVQRVDYVFRGVPVPAGRHEVVFEYRPWSWRVGWIVSLATLAGLAWAVALGLGGGRRPWR